MPKAAKALIVTPIKNATAPETDINIPKTKAISITTGTSTLYSLSKKVFAPVRIALAISDICDDPSGSTLTFTNPYAAYATPNAAIKTIANMILIHSPLLNYSFLEPFA